MRYRRFGRTELQMPVLTVGGMRYQHAWGDKDPAEIPEEAQANLEACIHHAFELGMNHIETARGYGTSEMQLGRVLPQLPREKLIVQTKIGPCEDPKEFLDRFEKSFDYLKVGYIDLLAFHGLHSQQQLDWINRSGGLMDVVRQLQREGRVRHIGFSTHGTTAEILNCIRGGEFDYVNLHWYYVNDLNWPCIEAATERDMGVFIISPNDKGGMLYKAPEKLVELCKPLSPMQFNDLYCLNRPQVHTLSIGASKPTDYDEHVRALAHYDNIPETIAPIEARIRKAVDEAIGEGWFEYWYRGLPDYRDIPGSVNILEILRLWTWAKSLGLSEWAKMRYNMLGSAGPWQPGTNAGEVVEELLAPVVKDNPFADRIPDILREAHALLVGEQQKRLSES
jgi:uncharacterized protein